MESEIENLRFEIKGLLFQLTIEQLMHISDSLEISGVNRERIAGKNRSSLVSHISQHMDRDETTELEDEGMAELLSLLDIIKGFPVFRVNTKEKEVKVGDDQAKLMRELENLRLAVQQKESEMRELTTRDLKSKDGELLKGNPPTTQLNSLAWRKDYKISGQIGEPGQKNRLTFSSLARQIENGLSRGYSETEIVDAVIRAIVPGLQLRSYLEGKSGLSLPTLRRILRSHYQERSATELYKQLTTEVQNNKETPQNFLIRAMDLRQKILFASQDAESNLKYDPVLVQSMFMHTIFTGLQSNNIKSDLQPYLLQPTTSDELLLERLNIACGHEKERQEKRRQTPQRPAGMHTVQSSDISGDRKQIVQQYTVTLPPDVLSDLKGLKADMVMLKDLKTEMAQIRESIQKTDHHTGYNSPVNMEMDCEAAQHSMNAQSQFAPWNIGSTATLHHNGRLVPDYSGGACSRRVVAPAQFQQRFAPQRYPMPRPRPRCRGCQQQGKEYCQHCYRCGSDEHFRAGCRRYQGQPDTVREAPLNGERLPPRDRE
ncbi:hypothetical protein QQF64_025193 [Cirrhinus molitorella]|uniref:CCHC-type domain-containing protein n=1 Tax=Cirrhinus molitorella TaxID=172907 RepID=A0ABR3NND3_9TELE